jgi:hypothetical protein
MERGISLRTLQLASYCPKSAVYGYFCTGSDPRVAICFGRPLAKGAKWLGRPPEKISVCRASAVKKSLHSLQGHFL